MTYTPPALPSSQLLTSLSATPITGKKIMVATTADIDQNGLALQAAIDSAQGGDVVLVPAGTVYRVGSLELRKKTGTGWITIESASLDALPQEGVRVSPTSRSDMPTLISPGGNTPIVLTEPGASYYRLIGLEITKLDPNSAIDEMVVLDAQFGLGAEYSPDLSSFPTNIIIDRCYIHGLPNNDLKRAIRMNCMSCAVINSYISEAHARGDDSQAIKFAGSTLKIWNNYLEGGAENVFGADYLALHQSPIAGQLTLTSAQLTTVKNLQVGMGIAFYDGTTNLYTTVRSISGLKVTFDPLQAIPTSGSKVYWGLIPTDIEIGYNYIYKPLAWKGFAGYHPEVKNLFELKSGRRVWFHHNVLENSWIDGQAGYAILLTVRNEADNCYFCAVEDVTLEANIIKNTNGGLNMLSTDYIYPSGPTRRVLIKNNLWLNVENTLQDGGIDNLTIDHNTVSIGSYAQMYEENESHSGNVFTNNIVLSTFASGFHYSSTTTPDWNHILPGWVLSKNVMSKMGTMSAYLGLPAALTLSNYEVDDPDAIQFSNWSGGDLSLSPTSWAKKSATDGTDLGADVAQLISQQQSIISGILVQPSQGNTDSGVTPSSTTDEPPTSKSEIYAKQKADFAVWRPSNGTWYVIPSSNPSTPLLQQWGLPGDVPHIPAKNVQ